MERLSTGRADHVLFYYTHQSRLKTDDVKDLVSWQESDCGNVQLRVVRFTNHVFLVSKATLFVLVCLVKYSRLQK